MLNRKDKEHIEGLLSRIQEGDHLHPEEVAALRARSTYLTDEQKAAVEKHAKMIGMDSKPEPEPESAPQTEGSDPVEPKKRGKK